MCERCNELLEKYPPMNNNKESMGWEKEKAIEIAGKVTDIIFNRKAGWSLVLEGELEEFIHEILAKQKSELDEKWYRRIGDELDKQREKIKKRAEEIIEEERYAGAPHAVNKLIQFIDSLK